MTKHGQAGSTPLGLFCAVYRKRMPCKGAIPVEKELMTTLLRKVYINDPNFDYPHLVSWVVFVDPLGSGDLLKPQMVSARVELRF
jgi:hypothetical protein